MTSGEDERIDCAVNLYSKEKLSRIAAQSIKDLSLSPRPGRAKAIEV